MDMLETKIIDMPSKPVIKRTNLIREIYRSLINTGRGYAAFTEKHRGLLLELSGKKQILDPMSGYGGLTRFCSALTLNSYSVEFNPPQYLWQILTLPQL